MNVFQKLLLSFFFLTFLVTPVVSQGEGRKYPAVGIGINVMNDNELSLWGLYDIIPSYFYVPIRLNQHIQIEPFFGFSFRPKHSDHFKGGIGIFHVPSQNDLFFEFYYGLRTTFRKSSGYEVSPTIGGGHYFNNRFSIAAELYLNSYFSGFEYFGIDSHSALMLRYVFK